MDAPLISLIVPTLGRTDAVHAMFTSLAASTYQNFEVLLVDQNELGMLDEIVALHAQNFTLHHLRTSQRGASHARNLGARQANGDLLAFPDDDCELFPDTLERSIESLIRHKVEVVFGRVQNRQGADAVTPFKASPGYLSREHYEGMFVECSTFMYKRVWQKFPFDETLGVGVFHGAEEGHDLVLRLLNAGVSMYYDPQIRFYHPEKTVHHRSRDEVRRVFTYRCGFARFCLKHKLYGRLASRMVKVVLYLFYLVICNPRKSRYYFAELLGLLSGMAVK